MPLAVMPAKVPASLPSSSLGIKDGAVIQNQMLLGVFGPLFPSLRPLLSRRAGRAAWNKRALRIANLIAMRTSVTILANTAWVSNRLCEGLGEAEPVFVLAFEIALGWRVPSGVVKLFRCHKSSLSALNLG